MMSFAFFFIFLNTPSSSTSSSELLELLDDDDDDEDDDELDEPLLLEPFLTLCRESPFSIKSFLKTMIHFKKFYKGSLQ